MTAYDAALKSPANKRALAGNVGGQARVQEVLSPDSIVGAAMTALGGEIGLDPCASTNPANWFATRNITLPSEAAPLELQMRELDKPATAAEKARAKALRAALRPFYYGHGLKADWGDYRDGAYVNEPFGMLRPWLMRCRLEAETTFRRIVMLAPVRTHRTWWVAALTGADVVWLDYRVVFKGHTSAFPAPLCLISWNCRVPDLGKRETGRWKP